METLYDHIFTEDGPKGRIYLASDGKRYSVGSYSLDNNTMRVDFGNAQADMHILRHLHDKHVISMTKKDLEILAEASKSWK